MDIEASITILLKDKITILEKSKGNYTHGTSIPLSHWNYLIFLMDFHCIGDPHLLFLLKKLFLFFLEFQTI